MAQPSTDGNPDRLLSLVPQVRVRVLDGNLGRGRSELAREHFQVTASGCPLGSDPSQTTLEYRIYTPAGAVRSNPRLAQRKGEPGAPGCFTYRTEKRTLLDETNFQ
jgi:hypothetical protein